MQPGLERLSPSERAVLRLLATGHDAKSAADELGISVTAVNERLREARRRLGVTSSRQAARLLAAAEHDGPKLVVDDKIGMVASPPPSSWTRRPASWVAGGHRSPLLVLGAVSMLALILSAAALWTVGTGRADGDAAPRVVRTTPVTDGDIPPGPFLLSVTFDRPMRGDSFSFVRRSNDTYPDCDRRPPVVSGDRRTFTLRCTAAPGHGYEVWFNSAPFLNFRSSAGDAAIPFRLRFHTRN